MRTNVIFEHLVSAHPALHMRAREIRYIHGDAVGTRGCPIEDIVFPRSGMISVVVALENGDLVESAMLGHGDAVGLGAIFGSPNYINTNIVQIPGDGWKLRVQDVMEAVEANASLAPLLFRCQEYLLSQAQQTAACNAKHHVKRRLASWLLRAEQACGNQELMVTQEIIAQTLGVQRATVSMVAAGLQDSNAISYRRGRIQILKREALEQESCGCHRSIQDQRVQLVSGNGWQVGRPLISTPQ